jgi:hypothetical protein
MLKKYFFAKCLFLPLLLLIIGNLGAENRETDEYADALMRLKEPCPPQLIDGGAGANRTVLFTFSGQHRRVGIAFAHENWTSTHWMRRLMLPIENTEVFDENSKKPRQFYHDSNIMALLYSPPDELDSLSYRLIVDGLWVPDPLNKSESFDFGSGITISHLELPHVEKPTFIKVAASKDDGVVSFKFSPRLESDTDPGYVSLAGNFNNWDPFMYQMERDGKGGYSLDLALPPGTYHYVFCMDGRRYRDPGNIKTVYLIDGSAASEIVLN